jgi:hypothetical protein
MEEWIFQEDREPAAVAAILAAQALARRIKGSRNTSFPFALLEEETSLSFGH